MIELTRVRKGHHHPLGFVDLVVEPFRLIFTIEIEPGVFTTDMLSLLLLLLLPDNSPLFLHYFVTLRSLITETCSRARIMARLRSENGFRPKWLLFCQESHAWFSFSGDSLPYLLTVASRLVIAKELGGQLPWS